MKKIFLSLLAAVAMPAAFAQFKCATDEVNNARIKQYPQIQVDMDKFNAEFDLYMKAMAKNNLAKTTAFGDTMHVPLVFHIVHNYGSEYVADTIVYQTVAQMNLMYNSLQPDTIDVITPFKKYLGKGNILFHLAQKDPNGNPTNGITRRISQLYNQGTDQAKIDGWPNNKYLNIWVVNTFDASHNGAAAYAYTPQSANGIPFYDGVISLSSYLNTDNTISHEVGHSLNLSHVWGNTNSAGVSCGDDNVDDTPPTKGHNPVGCVPAALYDVTCATNYIKNGIDYPDTVNAQNVMDYTYCSKMFTQLQMARCRAALSSATASRNNLWSAANLSATGILNTPTDLSPIADFSASKLWSVLGTVLPISITFKNQSWRDTISSIQWTFSNSPTISTATNSSVANLFNTPGWVSVKLVANANSGKDSITKNHYVYIADTAAIIPGNYVQKFNNADTNTFPCINYFENSFKWEYVNGVGFDDNSCIRYNNFDTRTGNAAKVGKPEFDYDDFFTPGFDFTNVPSSAPLTMNFYTSGAYRNTAQADVLDVYATKNWGITWTKLPAGSLTNNSLSNNGLRTTAFTPTAANQWQMQTLDLSSYKGSNHVYFKFRYTPSVDNNDLGAGNHFYLDNLQITQFPLGVDATQLNGQHAIVAPNPATQTAYITLVGLNNETVQVQLVDITGSIVASLQVAVQEDKKVVAIPVAHLAKGMYMVRMQSSKFNQADKLIIQ
jgi:hypothetical protein